jgi:membrane protein implicated in regulation of membrane protease activity
MSVTAKVVVEIGDNAEVSIDEEIEFQGTGEGEYTWDFDESIDEDKDGNFVNDAEKTGKTVTHKFEKSGTYIVTLTVTQGNSSQQIQSKITVVDEDLFDPWILGLIMLVMGIILFIVEASSPGFFIGIFASIFVVIGIIGIALPGLFFTVWSPIIAAIVGIGTTVFVIFFYKKLAPPEKPTTTVAESLIGKTGIVMVDTDPNSLTKGKVKVGSDVWSATSEPRIRKGSKVVVVDSEGVHITVKKIE